MTSKTQIGDVTYNAATQRFEALVIFHTDAGRVRIAATHSAPLSADYSVIADGLWQAALKNLAAPDALQARLGAKRVKTARQTRMLPRVNGWMRVLTGQKQAA